MSFIETLRRSLGSKENTSQNNSFQDEIDVIEPEQSFYEIIMIKPRSMDDIDYVFDQIVEENNPVIVDLGYLENEGSEIFKKAGEKIRILRHEYNAESILFCRDSTKNIIIISPPRVRLIIKD